MPKQNDQPATVSALDPRDALRTALDAQILTAQGRKRELASTIKQLERELEAQEETIRIAEAAIGEASESLGRTRELALAESV